MPLLRSFLKISPANETGFALIQRHWGLGEGLSNPLFTKKNLKPKCHAVLSGAALLALAATVVAGAESAPQASPDAKPAPYDPKVFLRDPSYEDKPYDAAAQVDIYGGKRPVPATRPFLEEGRELYKEGPFRVAPSPLGKKNLVFAHLMAYGDWRTAIAYNDVGGKELETIATRLNLDVDLKLTATERIHAFFRPMDHNGQFTRYDFKTHGDKHAQPHFDGNLDALFFEGDAGAIAAGLSDRYNRVDLPFAVGLMPLLFQNGVWVEDAFTGFAFTIPSRNSRVFDISNMDITFFAGFDKVTTGALRDAAGRLADHNARIFGVTAFIEANQGYWELGYGYTLATDEFKGLDYHNVTAAFTRRYLGKISNTLRVIGNFGQDPKPGQTRTADGVLLLVENSLVSPLPLTLVPYFNLFAGFNHPQSLARDAGAGGVLKNTGILFETDGLTGYPTLDATATRTYGGALGLEYLFNLNQQIVVEAAAVRIMGDENEPNRPAKGDQYGVGIRYQIPLTRSWILRADAMLGWRNQEEDLAGARLEFRYKF